MYWAAHSLIHGPKSATISSSPHIARDLPASGRLGDDDQPLALAEPGRRRPLRQARDPLEDVALHAALLEPPHGPALHHDVDELHLALLMRLVAAVKRPSG